MKRILLALTMVGFLLSLALRAQAAEVSLDFFYDNLSSQGSWIEVADYGYCFQPNVAVNNPDWRPYADGYWAYTDAGWTWVSYEDFGWATYHYGRWANLDDYGWVWAPGYEWGPAWVSWRTGGDYVGWAPLPPQTGVVYEGQPITGAVDVSFGIGPLYYNFVDIRYIGEPVLRGRIIEPRRNVTIINQTVNVTNITYNNTTVINNGPDLNRVNQFSTRPIQRLKLQRETNISGDIAGRRGNLNRVNGNTLVVAAPAVQRSQQKLVPKQVKTKVAQPKLERGWQGVDNRQQVEEQMKKENAKNVPPPSFQPQKERRGQAAGGQGPGAQPNETAPTNAEQTAGQPAEGGARDQQTQRVEQRRAERERQREAGMKEQQAAKGTNQQKEQTAQQPRQTKRGQPPQQQQPQEETTPGNRPEQAAQPERAKSLQPERRQQAGQAPDQQSEQARRRERAQAPQEGQSENRPQQAEQARRPEGAQPNRRQEQARPQQQQQQGQTEQPERKGNKKKPVEESPPPQG